VFTARVLGCFWGTGMPIWGGGMPARADATAFRPILAEFNHCMRAIQLLHHYGIGNVFRMLIVNWKAKRWR